MENINPLPQYDDEDRETDTAWEEFAKFVAEKRKKNEESFYPYPVIPDEDIINNLVR